MRIELIYDADCPNVPAARQALTRACASAGVEPAWQEWDRSRPDAPARTLTFGSPTVLVDGRDVAGDDTNSDAKACRVYRAADGQLTGSPPAEMIAASLAGAKPKRGRPWWGGVTAAGAGVASLLPVLSCAACWPAYAGVLGALGVGFVNYTPS